MLTVSYLRVSTAKQGRSGLGLDAQREAVSQYVTRVGAELLEEFVETESGKNAHRPILAKALHRAKVTDATLVIAKLDRLSRNAAFLLALRDSGVKFVAADMPDATDLTVGILAVVAQAERDAISRRTREALAAAKRRGKILGNPNGASALRRAATGNAASVKVIRERAAQYAEDLRPIIGEIKQAGAKTLEEIAAELNARQIRTPRDRRWHKSSVRNLMLRLRPAACEEKEWERLFEDAARNANCVTGKHQM